MNGSQISLILCLVAQFIDQLCPARPACIPLQARCWPSTPVAGPGQGLSGGQFLPETPSFPFSFFFLFFFLSLGFFFFFWQNKENRCRLRASHTHSNIWKLSPLSLQLHRSLLFNGFGFYCTETNLFLHKTFLRSLPQGLLGEVLSGIKMCRTPWQLAAALNVLSADLQGTRWGAGSGLEIME